MDGGLGGCNPRSGPCTWMEVEGGCEWEFMKKDKKIVNTILDVIS